MFFINVDRSSNNPRFEAQTHRTQPQQFALAVLHQSQRSLFFIDLEANRVRTRHQMVQTPISSFITASTADLMSSSLVIQREPWELIKDEDIKKTAASFSAIKVGGEKMYEKARRGESIELSPRRISIFQFEIKRSLDNRQNLIFRVTCSKGTYIRSLCANLGKAQNSFQLCTFLGFVESFNQFL